MLLRQNLEKAAKLPTSMAAAGRVGAAAKVVDVPDAGVADGPVSSAKDLDAVAQGRQGAVLDAYLPRAARHRERPRPRQRGEACSDATHPVGQPLEVRLARVRDPRDGLRTRREPVGTS